MAESSVRTPLLQDIEEDNINSVCQVVTRDGRNNEGITALSPVLCSFSPAAHNIPTMEDVDSPPPDIICVFVVAFDTRAGNIIEYCVPDDIDLDGIEFKAMASGSHNISYDFTYFKKGKFYGLSCFENMPVDSQIERGARMKSVGILAPSYLHLHRYKSFLEQQVCILLKSPGHYDNLDKFYANKRGVLQSSSNTEFASHVEAEQTLNSLISSLPSLKTTHPTGCFSQFVRFFGQQIFLLWKYALLKKRILFFSPPPIGVVCYRVYCTNCLSSHQVGEIPPTSANVLFYVNVADVDMLESADNYIACTTEKILEGKTQLYDVYVDNQNVSVQSGALKAITLTAADKLNFTKLTSQQRGSLPGSNYGETNDESTFMKFFENLNNKLFSTLLDASYTQDKSLTFDQIRTIGLDPSGDRQFLKDIIQLYRLNVHLAPDSPCC